MHRTLSSLTLTLTHGTHNKYTAPHTYPTTLLKDRLSQALLAIGYDGKLFSLGLKPVSLPVETVYIGSDRNQCVVVC